MSDETVDLAFTRTEGASPNQMRVDLADKRAQQARALAEARKKKIARLKKKLKGRKSGSSGSSQSKKGQSQRARNWDESKHPRVGAGNPQGGTFTTTKGGSKQQKGKSSTARQKAVSALQSNGLKAVPSDKRQAAAEHLKHLRATQGGTKAKGKTASGTTGVKPPSLQRYEKKLAEINGEKAKPKKKGVASPAERKAQAQQVMTTAHQKLLRETAAKQGWKTKNGKLHTEYLNAEGDLVRVDFTAGPKGITATEEESGKSVTYRDARKIVAWLKKGKASK